MDIHDFNSIRSVQIQTIDYCNRKCPWCPNKDLEKTPNRLMTKKIFSKILADLKKLKYRGTFHPYLMGEPLCDKRFKDLLKIIQRQFPKNGILINTNGDFLKNRNDILELFKIGLHKIVINLYDERNVQLRKNAYGMKKVIFRTITFLKKREFWNRGGLVDFSYSIPQKTSCNFIFQKMCINYLGDVILCCSDYHYEVVYGNVMKTRLIDIWNSPKYQYVRQMHVSGNAKKLPICKKCNRIKKGMNKIKSEEDE